MTLLKKTSIVAMLLLGISSTAYGSILFSISEYSETTFSFQISGTLDQAYDANDFDSLLQINPGSDLSQLWTSSVTDFSGTSLVDGVGDVSDWSWADNGSDTGFALFFPAGGTFSTILPAGTVFDFDVTASGVFDVINYAPGDFGVYLGNSSEQNAQFLLATAQDVPAPAPLVLMSLGLGLLYRGLRRKA